MLARCTLALDVIELLYYQDVCELHNLWRSQRVQRNSRGNRDIPGRSVLPFSRRCTVRAQEKLI